MFLLQYLPLPNVTVPSPAPKGKYGNITLVPVSLLLNTTPDKIPVRSMYPLTFEELGQKYGFMLYQTTLMIPIPDPSLLSIPAIGDRAIVMVNGVSINFLFEQHYTVNSFEIQGPFNKYQD